MRRKAVLNMLHLDQTFHKQCHRWPMRVAGAPLAPRPLDLPDTTLARPTVDAEAVSAVANIAMIRGCGERFHMFINLDYASPGRADADFPDMRMHDWVWCNNAGQKTTDANLELPVLRAALHSQCSTAGMTGYQENA